MMKQRNMRKNMSAASTIPLSTKRLNVVLDGQKTLLIDLNSPHLRHYVSGFQQRICPELGLNMPIASEALGQHPTTEDQDRISRSVISLNGINSDQFWRRSHISGVNRLVGTYRCHEAGNHATSIPRLRLGSRHGVAEDYHAQG